MPNIKDYFKYIKSNSTYLGRATITMTIIILLSMMGVQVIGSSHIFNQDSNNTPQSSHTSQLRPTPTPPHQNPATTPSLTVYPTSNPTAIVVGPSTSLLPTAIPLQPEIIWGNRSVKQVVFTFDAGSGNQSINQVLQTLKDNQLESTFFVTGNWAQAYPDDLKRIAREGHAIYNHTVTHPHLTQLSDQQIVTELSQADQTITELVGFSSKPFFRAPYGERDNRILSVAASQGYRHVYWTIDALDWKEGITAQQVEERILNNLQPGTIYLMHVGDKITGQILPRIFQEIHNRGYTINSLSAGL